MQRQQNGLFQIGVAIAVLGVAIKVALLLTALFNPLATWAIIIGAVLIVIGLVTPGRGY